MPVNDNAHALRLHQALTDAGYAVLAETIANGSPLSKSADVTKKYTWACAICKHLETALPREDAVQIRRACRCNNGTTMANEISSCIKKTTTLEEACVLFTNNSKYAFLEYVNDHELVFGYHNCVCSCIKRAEGEVPLLWCECSVGYAEAMFQQVFGNTVRVTLLGSSKSSTERCSFHIEW